MGVERHTSGEAIAAEWDALAREVGAPPFARPGWNAAWWNAFGNGALELLAARRDGALTGVLPIVRRAGGVHVPANWHTPVFAAAARDEETRRELYDAAFATSRPYANLRLLGDDAAVAEDVARDRRFDVSVRVLQSSPYVDLRRELPAPREKTLRKAREKLAREEGETSLEVLGSTEGVLDEAFELEGSGWKVDDGTAIVSRDDTKRFYTDVLHWAEREGILRLFFLCAGDRRIAVELTLVQDGMLYDLKGGYDPAYRKYSPGFLIADAMIRHSQADGLATYELLGAAEPWKLEWTDLTRDRFAVEAFAAGPLGAAARFGYRRAQPLAKRVLRRA